MNFMDNASESALNLWYKNNPRRTRKLPANPWAVCRAMQKKYGWSDEKTERCINHIKESIGYKKGMKLYRNPMETWNDNPKRLYLKDIQAMDLQRNESELRLLEMLVEAGGNQPVTMQFFQDSRTYGLREAYIYLKGYAKEGQWRGNLIKVRDQVNRILSRHAHTNFVENPNWSKHPYSMIKPWKQEEEAKYIASMYNFVDSSFDEGKKAQARRGLLNLQEARENFIVLGMTHLVAPLDIMIKELSIKVQKESKEISTKVQKQTEDIVEKQASYPIIPHTSYPITQFPAMTPGLFRKGETVVIRDIVKTPPPSEIPHSSIEEYRKKYKLNPYSSNFRSPSIKITSDGEISPLTPRNGTNFSLEELQAVVNGYIEVVYLRDGRLMIVDEEGLLKGKPMNQIASESAGHVIVGNVAIIHEDQMR